MRYRIRDESDAARFISIAFGDEPLLSAVKEMLGSASGGCSPILSKRHLTASEVELLAQHRVVSLIPTSWTVGVSAADYSQRLTTLAIDRLRLTTVMHSVVELLASASIECRVLKGLATSRLDYGNPNLRDTGDVDLLIRPSQIDHAAELLSAHGCVPYPGQNYDQRFEKGMVLVHPENIQIDLHTRLFRFHQQDIDLLMARPDSIGSHQAFALNKELRLIHAASHLAYSAPGSRRLSGVADITAIVESATVDWGSVRETARRLHIESMVGLGLRVEAVLMGRDSEFLAEWSTPTGLERLSFSRDHRFLAAEKLLAFTSSEGTRAKVRFINRLTFPSRDTAALRGGYWAYYSKILPRRFGGPPK